MHRYSKPVDNMVKTGQNRLKVIHILTKVLRFSRAGEPLAVSSKARRNAFGLALCLAAISMQTMPLNATTKVDYYKLYLHSKVINEKQYMCGLYVGFTESRWNETSRNHDHYGLFQMKNIKAKYMNGYQQIDMWLKYVAHRYDNNLCKAKQHLIDKGWQ